MDGESVGKVATIATNRGCRHRSLQIPIIRKGTLVFLRNIYNTNISLKFGS